MVRFLHTADWQIGMKAAHVGEVGPRVRAERLAAAKRVVEVANQQNAEFLLVAGDTFEDNAVDRILVQQVADILSKFAGPAFVIPGNHDPLVPGSVWEHPAWRSHPQITVVREAVPIELPGATLFPSPCREKYSLADPTRWIDAATHENVSIGLAHGTVEGVGGDEIDHPIPRDAPARAGLDYLAIGHWHSFATFPDHEGSSRLCYCGTHETTKFGERDSGNVLLVEIDERGAPPRVTSIRTAGLSWKQLAPRIVEAGDVARILDEAEGMADAESTLLEIKPEGLFGRDDQADLDRLAELLDARFLFGRLDLSNLHLRPDDDRWLDDLPAGVIRESGRRLQALADPGFFGDRPEDASPEVAKRALLELYRLVRETAE